MKYIRGYEGRYSITSCGRVWSHISNRFLTAHLDKDGYFNIVLLKNGIQKNHKVHRLVAEAYLHNVYHKPCINHKDEIRSHNYLSNLEWVTVAENNSYGLRMAKFEKAVMCIETEEIYKSAREAGRQTHIEASNIIRCCNNVRITAGNYHWKYKGGDDK